LHQPPSEKAKVETKKRHWLVGLDAFVVHLFKFCFGLDLDWFDAHMIVICSGLALAIGLMSCRIFIEQDIFIGLALMLVYLFFSYGLVVMFWTRKE
jgi:hypothetical protein